MKYSVYSLLICTFIPFIFAQAQTKNIKPINSKSKVSIIVSGNNREYFPLDQERENIISLKGPGKLKVITRPRIKSDQKNISYSVFYKIDGADRKESKIKNKGRGKNVAYKNSNLGTPGEDNTIELNLDEGEHTIQIWGGTKKTKVDARCLFIPSKKKKTKWMTLAPANNNEVVSLVTEEQVINYFRFSEEKPIKVKIIGPTKLRILTRVENHFGMKGRIFYRVKVTEDGKLKNTYQLNSVRSETAVYQKEPDKLPGRPREIVIDVPAGVHYYEILPLDKDKNTLLGKVFFPKKDIKLGE